MSGDSVACRPVVLRTPFADEWLGVGCDQEQRHTLDSDDAVVLRDHPGELGRSEPARVQPLQVCVGRPTGDGAALSDVDRNAVVDELLQQLLQRRNADTFDPPCVLARDELRPVACQRNRALLPFDDRAVGRNVERKRRSRRIARPGRYQRGPSSGERTPPGELDQVTSRPAPRSVPADRAVRPRHARRRRRQPRLLGGLRQPGRQAGARRPRRPGLGLRHGQPAAPSTRTATGSSCSTSAAAGGARRTRAIRPPT